MLNLAECVAKRARIDLVCDSHSSYFDDLGHGHPPADLITDQLRTRPSPSRAPLNLGSAEALAPTQTLVFRAEPLRLGTPQNEIASRLGDQYTKPYRLDLKNSAARRINRKPSSLSEECVSASEEDNGEKTGVSSVSSLRSTGPLRATWDLLNEREPDAGQDSIVDTLCLADFERPKKHEILIAAANAAVGFESNLANWDESSMRLRIAPYAQESNFGEYLEIFAQCGAYVRRLLDAVVSIRAKVCDRDDSRTALALAASIESELAHCAQLPSMDPTNGLVSLYAHCFRTNALACNLAELVGCADMKSAGHLIRVPSAVTLLDRVYRRAMSQQLYQRHGAMLWRLVSTTLNPWLAQLNFAIGLSKPSITRQASASMRTAYFPELFVSVSEAVDQVTLDVEALPVFVSPEVAQAVVQCYNMLVLMGFKGPDAANAGATLMPMLKLSGQGDTRRRVPNLPLRFQQPDSVEIGVHNVLVKLDASNASQDTDMQPVFIEDPHPDSVEFELWRTLAPIALRHKQLNTTAREVLRSDIAELRKVVTGLYFLGDGVFWSHFQDLVQQQFSDWRNAAVLTLPVMNALVEGAYPGVHFTVKAEEWGSLSLIYECPKALRVALPERCFTEWQSVFSTLIHTFYNTKGRAFALLTAEAMTAIQRLDKSLDDSTCGINEVLSAFAKSPTLLLNSLSSAT